MDRNQGQAKKTLASLLLFLCFYHVASSQPSTNKSYRLTFSMTYDGEESPFGNPELFIIGSLAFEEISTIVDKRISTLQPDNIFSVEHTTKDSLTKYVVTNLKSKKCYVFSLANPPGLLQTVPLSAKEKIYGQFFKDEAYMEIGNSAKNFNHIADTLIGDFKYQVLENAAGFSLQNIKYQNARVFMNMSLQQFPFHPVSTKIDKLFGGIVTRIELYGDDGKAFVTNYTIDAIPQEKFAFINRYLKLAVK